MDMFARNGAILVIIEQGSFLMQATERCVINSAVANE